MTFFDKLERFLRIDPEATKSELMRYRAVYMMGLAFIATQMINLIAMYYSYGEFTVDHIISLIACGLVGLTILLLRHSKHFPLFALIYSVLIIGGTLSSALNQNTGINSALIPFFILGVIVNGFICGWRSTMAFGAFSLVAIWFLWWITSLATILITMVGAFFSKNMHEAFGELEVGITIAQASDRAKTDFLATMSHELCTPMNGIIGMNDALEETELNEDQREITSVIRDSGRDLQTIIGNVLLFSQLEAGRVSLDSSPFNLSRALRDTIKPFAATAKAKGLAFKARMAPTVPPVLIGDKVRTAQIICALLDNAIKFTDEGVVELLIKGTETSQGLASLTVIISDTGIGIEPGHEDRIFERFTQQDGSIKRRHGGTGLGLTIARGLTEMMGGTLTVESEPNRGSSFTLNLNFEMADPVQAQGWKEAAE